MMSWAVLPDALVVGWIHNVMRAVTVRSLCRGCTHRFHGGTLHCPRTHHSCGVCPQSSAHVCPGTTQRPWCLACAGMTAIACGSRVNSTRLCIHFIQPAGSCLKDPVQTVCTTTLLDLWGDSGWIGTAGTPIMVRLTTHCIIIPMHMHTTLATRCP